MIRVQPQFEKDTESEAKNQDFLGFEIIVPQNNMLKLR